MVKVCATISDILAQRSCLINEQTLASPRAFLAHTKVASVPIADQHRQSRVLREPLVRLRPPAEIEPAPPRVFNEARVLAVGT